MANGSHEANWYAEADLVSDDGQLYVEVVLKTYRHDRQRTEMLTIRLPSLMDINGESMTVEQVMRRLERPA